jgi:hypothetical protein
LKSDVDRNCMHGRSAIFPRITVLLGHSSVTDQSTARAVEWCRDLHATLRLVVLSALPRTLTSNSAVLAFNGAPASPSDPERACHEAIRPAAAEIGWIKSDSVPEILCWNGQDTGELWRASEPEDLLVINDGLTMPLRQRIIQDWILGAPPALLAGTPDRTPFGRMLVINDAMRTSAAFLVQTAQLARSLKLACVVLTVARTEPSARGSQQVAQRLFAQQHIEADFDLLVGSSSHKAISSVARWRRCGLVVLERPDETPWTRWFGRGDAEFVFEACHSLSLLGLPCKSARCHAGLEFSQ